MMNHTFHMNYHTYACACSAQMASSASMDSLMDSVNLAGSIFVLSGQIIVGIIICVLIAPAISYPVADW